MTTTHTENRYVRILGTIALVTGVLAVLSVVAYLISVATSDNALYQPDFNPTMLVIASVVGLTWLVVKALTSHRSQ